MVKRERQDDRRNAGGGAGGEDASRPGLRLRLVGASAPGRPLSKAQKKFDRLLRKVETLRAERARLTTRWEKFLKVYQERIHPQERRMLERRKQVVRVLAGHWRKPKGLGKRQREALEEMLVGQLRALFEGGPEWFDDELRTLWDALRASSSPAVTEDENAEVDKSETAEEATPFEDADDRASRDASDVGGSAAEAAGAARPKSPRQEAAERLAAERAARREEARKRTVVGIYKQLAKVLHPDLERDPVLRERKLALMQDLTKAHREGDLHTLLRLELEWIAREEGELERLGEEKLGIYSELLEEQVGELQAELRDLPFAPRFAAVARFTRPFGQGPENVESILLSIRETSEALRRLRDALEGPRSRETLGEVLRDSAARRREMERWRGFMEGFGPGAGDDF